MITLNEVITSDISEPLAVVTAFGFLFLGVLLIFVFCLMVYLIKKDIKKYIDNLIDKKVKSFKRSLGKKKGGR